MPGCWQVIKHSLLHRNTKIHYQALRNLSWEFFFFLFNNRRELRKHYLEEQPSGAVREGSSGSYLDNLWCVCWDKTTSWDNKGIKLFLFPIYCFIWWCFKSEAYCSVGDGLYRRRGSFQHRSVSMLEQVSCNNGNNPTEHLFASVCH